MTCSRFANSFIRSLGIFSRATHHNIRHTHTHTHTSPRARFYCYTPKTTNTTHLSKDRKKDSDPKAEKKDEELAGKLAQLEKKNQRLLKQLEETLDAKETAEKKLATTATSNPAELEALKAQVAKLEASAKASLAERDEAADKLHEMEGHVKGLERALAGASKPSGAAGANAALVSSLESRASSAEKERDELRGELAETKDRVDELEELTARLEKKPVPAAAAAAAAAAPPAGDKGLRTENEKLQAKTAKLEEELEETHRKLSKFEKKKRDPEDSDESESEPEEEDRPKKGTAKSQFDSAGLIRQIFESVHELQFSANGCPKTATLLLDQLSAQAAFKQPTNDATYTEILSAFSLASKVHTDGYRLAMYWVSTAWWTLKGARESMKQAGPEPTTVKRPMKLKSMHQASFQHSHACFTTRFAAALGKAYRSIDGIVVTCMVEHTQQSGTTSTPIKASAAAAVTPAAAAAAMRTPAQVIAIFAEVMHAATDVKLVQGVRQQIAAQLAHCVNAGVFNALVTRPELCTCASGMQIRLSMSQLEDWLARDGDCFAARKKLAHAARQPTCSLWTRRS